MPLIPSEGQTPDRQERMAVYEPSIATKYETLLFQFWLLSDQMLMNRRAIHSARGRHKLDYASVDEYCSEYERQLDQAYRGVKVYFAEQRRKSAAARNRTMRLLK